MVMAWGMLGALKDGQFHKVMDGAAWADFKPAMFDLIEKKGKFIIQIELICGCLLPIFYEVTKAHFTDETTRDILVSRIAKPKDWEAQCPFRVLPESAKGQTVFGFTTNWTHKDVALALGRLEESDASHQVPAQPVDRAQRRRRLRAVRP